MFENEFAEINFMFWPYVECKFITPGLFTWILAYV